MSETGKSQAIADGEHCGVRWYVERPADMTPPKVLVTFQTWHAQGRTYVSERHERDTLDRAKLIRMIDELLCRLEAKDAAGKARVARFGPQRRYRQGM